MRSNNTNKISFIVLFLGIILFSSCTSLTSLGIPYPQRLAQLKNYDTYKDDGISIPFTYDLNRRDLYTELINEYDLDAVVEGHSDVDLMMILLNWVCDNFEHNGGSGLPDERDAVSLIKYYNENPGGINCRGVAMILAELLRLYGIEAKHITVCSPDEDAYVHVVTHAYSKELNQWIMLDPTYRLILKDEKGKYMDLAMLRNSFINNEQIFANENAGHNKEKFTIDSYKRFMVDYMFRFTCTTHYTFGSEGGENILIPVGYDEKTQAEVITTSPTAFWIIP
jgi:transglutaminase-like putative cysteine protease